MLTATDLRQPRRSQEKPNRPLPSYDYSIAQGRPPLRAWWQQRLERWRPPLRTR
jgi:hypothetical protein